MNAALRRYGGLKTAEERAEAAKWILFANATFGERADAAVCKGRSLHTA